MLLQKTKQSSGLSTWLVNLTSRKRKQVATVALANKMARMAWAVLYKGEAYRPPTVPQVIAAGWPAHDAWHIAPGLEIADSIPTSATQQRRVI